MDFLDTFLTVVFFPAGRPRFLVATFFVAGRRRFAATLRGDFLAGFFFATFLDGLPIFNSKLWLKNETSTKLSQ
jgi:hypothetical protein